MAEEALKKLEEQLSCSICLDTYTNPKLLQCFHVYCQQCLVPLVDRDQRGQLGLSCPICRQVTPVPNRGVAGLQSAFHINHLLELQDSFQKLDNPAAALEEAVGDTTNAAPSREAVRHCFEHPDEELKLYCETCGELVCLKCAIKGLGKHFGHDYKELHQTFREYKEGITSSLEPMEKQVAILKGVLAQLDTRCGEISDQREATEDEIHSTFRRLQEVLNVRETELIYKLHRITQSKLKALAVQRDKIETILAQLSSCLLFMGESIREANKDHALMTKTNTVNTIKQLTTPFQSDILEPSTEADIVFSALADLHSMCRDYGQVFAQGSPDPSKCHATGKGLEVAVVGEKSTCILHSNNFEGTPCVGSIKTLDCELLSEITGAKASCSAERRQSQDEISYQPAIKGRHQLHIRVEGKHIRGSPFSVAVKLPVEKLGTPILTIGGGGRPRGVAINHRGEVVVTELDNHRIQVLSPSGEKIRSFGNQGSAMGQFHAPIGVAVDGEGNILVADSDNHRIQKFTAEGQFLTAVGTKGNGPLQFTNPIDIAISDKVYVVDNDKHCVQVLNPDLTFTHIFGKKSGKGQFQNPYGIACDRTGKVYVTDSGNHRIQVFTAEGKFLRMFGQYGQGMGELDWPTGIAIDTSGIVYVSEGGNNRVSLFTSEGQFVTSFGRGGEGPGEFKLPTGLAVDSSGVLYVCDYFNNRVQLF